MNYILQMFRQHGRDAADLKLQKIIIFFTQLNEKNFNHYLL